MFVSLNIKNMIQALRFNENNESSNSAISLVKRLKKRSYKILIRRLISYPLIILLRKMVIILSILDVFRSSKILTKSSLFQGEACGKRTWYWKMVSKSGLSSDYLTSINDVIIDILRLLLHGFLGVHNMAALVSWIFNK